MLHYNFTVLETSPGRNHILQPVDAKPLADLFMTELAQFPGFDMSGSGTVLQQTCCKRDFTLVVIYYKELCTSRGLMWISS